VGTVSDKVLLQTFALLLGGGGTENPVPELDLDRDASQKEMIQRRATLLGGSWQRSQSGPQSGLSSVAAAAVIEDNDATKQARNSRARHCSNTNCTAR
jgi:hypothetical protein